MSLKKFPVKSKQWMLLNGSTKKIKFQLGYPPLFSTLGSTTSIVSSSRWNLIWTFRLCSPMVFSKFSVKKATNVHTNLLLLTKLFTLSKLLNGKFLWLFFRSCCCDRKLYLPVKSLKLPLCDGYKDKLFERSKTLLESSKKEDSEASSSIRPGNAGKDLDALNSL